MDKLIRMAEEQDSLPMNTKDTAVVDMPPPKSPVVMSAGIGNPAPLGLLCFGMTTVMLMFVTTTWVEAAFATTVITYACFYGGFGQMVAGVFELIKGNTFAGTAFFSYGAFWMAYFVGALLAKSGNPAYAAPAAFKVGETLFLCLWGVFTFGFFVPTLRKNGCLMTVFGSLTCTFFLLAGGQWSISCNKAAGYVGFFCGCSAIYTAFAEIYHESLGIVLPGLRPVKFIGAAGVKVTTQAMCQ
eukprot:jgi/Chrzof1/891/Cz01g32260.t1